MNIKGKAVLIGYDRDGNCVYSEILELSDYYDGLHIWDDGAELRKLKLVLLRGFLFDSSGELSQEFESDFDSQSGIYKSGIARFADGTVRKDGTRAKPH